MSFEQEIIGVFDNIEKQYENADGELDLELWADEQNVDLAWIKERGERLSAVAMQAALATGAPIECLTALFGTGFQVGYALAQARFTPDEHIFDEDGNPVA